ncbi:hypothetical protein H4R35_000495 [Dimargaris xerosporica]|nr:hypothetical protein H4R35_000495 [Dimargaris xerosporica]
MPAISKAALVVGLALLPHLAAVFGRPLGEPSSEPGTNSEASGSNNKERDFLERTGLTPAQLQTNWLSASGNWPHVDDPLSMSGTVPYSITGDVLTDIPGSMYASEEAVIQHFMRQVDESDKDYAQATPFGNHGLAQDLHLLLTQMNSAKKPSPNFTCVTAAVALFTEYSIEYTAKHSPYSWIAIEYMMSHFYDYGAKEMTPSEQRYLYSLLSGLRENIYKYYDFFESRIVDFSQYLVNENYKHPDQLGVQFGTVDKGQALAIYISDHLLHTGIDPLGHDDAIFLYDSFASSQSGKKDSFDALPMSTEQIKNNILSMFDNCLERYQAQLSPKMNRIIEKVNALTHA